MVSFLNPPLSKFMARYPQGMESLEKIKTIGDAYMVVSGLPESKYQVHIANDAIKYVRVEIVVKAAIQA